MEELLEKIGILATRCVVFKETEKDILYLGTLDVTTRGCVESDMDIIADFVH